MAIMDVRVKGLSRVNRTLNRISFGLGRAAQRDSGRIANDYKQGLKQSVLSHDLVWRGMLLDSIRRRKTSDDSFSIFVRDYGVMLDRMGRHWVYVGPTPSSSMRTKYYRTLERWKREHLGEDSSPFFMVGSLRNIGWIGDGLARGRSRIRNRLRDGDITRLFKGGVF